MDWKNVGKKLLEVGAPILGVALAGPVGGIAAKAALSLIGAKFSIKEEYLTPEAVTDIIRNPDHVLKLRELEIDGEVELRRLMNQESEMYLADKQDSRKREVEVVKATGTKDWNLYILAWIVVAGFFGLCAGLMRLTLPEGSNEVVFMLFGGLVAGFSTVISYFFGSSKSSIDKTKLIAGK